VGSERPGGCGQLVVERCEVAVFPLAVEELPRLGRVDGAFELGDAL
jgi:hypothetical protein